MIQKNRVFDGLISGSLQDPGKGNQKYIQRFNDVIIAKEFGYSYQDIMSLPKFFYDDCLLILSKQNARQAAQQEKIRKK